jgi:hypothetical protein
VQRYAADRVAVPLSNTSIPVVVANRFRSEANRSGSADLSGSAVIDDITDDVVEKSSRNGPTTMQRQIGFAEAESARKQCRCPRLTNPIAG